MVLPWFGALLVAAACTAGGTPAPGDQAATEGKAPTPETLRQAYRTATKAFSLAPIDWSPCPLTTDGSGTDAQCADIAVPLSWLEPHSGTTSVFVKRVSPAVPPEQQLWLLTGGPGFAGNSLDMLAGYLRAQLPAAELFLVDFRGIGRSARLACPEVEDVTGHFLIDRALVPDSGAAVSAVQQCFDAVEADVPLPELRNFNTTETAMDVGMLADALRAPNARLLVYGISFGTYIAHRYMHLFPEQPAGVILDSFVHPDGITTRDLDADRIAREILGVCAMDPDCKAHLGADPAAFATSLVERLGQGHCPELASAGIDQAGFQVMAERAVLDSAQRSFLPALYYRADRCARADVAALVKYKSTQASAPTPTSVRDSDALYLLVARSELFNHTILDTLVDSTATLVASVDLATHFRAIWDAIPSYPRDAFWGEWARIDAPLLIVQGELDANTPPSNGAAARDHFAGPNTHFVSFPFTNHVVFADLDCGGATIVRFMADPTHAPDSSCTSQLKPPSFSVDATAKFGQASVWDNTTP
jgi:pimeloyl-ACP methyl ester carboxylesterase